MLVKTLPLEFKIPKQQQYKKKYKLFFLKKKQKINLFSSTKKHILSRILSVSNMKISSKHLQVVYKKLKYDSKQGNLRLLKLKCSIYMFPFISVTKKPKDIRMGRGKGLPFFYFSKLQIGSVFLDFKYYSINSFLWLLFKLKNAIPFKFKVIFPLFW